MSRFMFEDRLYCKVPRAKIAEEFQRLLDDSNITEEKLHDDLYQRVAYDFSLGPAYYDPISNRFIIHKETLMPKGEWIYHLNGRESGVYTECGLNFDSDAWRTFALALGGICAGYNENSVPSIVFLE